MRPSPDSILRRAVRCWSPPYLAAIAVLGSLAILAANGLVGYGAEGQPSRESLLRQVASLQARAEQLRHDGKPAEAVAAASRVLDIQTQLFGTDSDSLADTLRWLIEAQAALGNFREAIALAERLSMLTQRRYGKDHPEHLVSLNNLAELYQAQGAYDRAEPLLREVLVAQQRRHGPSSRDEALALNNLAGLYQAVGDYVQAEVLLHRAVDLYDQSLGPRHPDSITSHNNLAGLYYEQGDFAAAERLFTKVLQDRKDILGISDPDYATSLNNLAAAREAQGDLTAAAQFYQEALQIRKRVLGTRHAAYAASLTNLAAVRRAQGDYVRADSLLREALEVRRLVFGPKHPDYAVGLNNLAALDRCRGNFEQAMPLYREALEIHERVLQDTFLVLSERQQRSMTAALRRTLDGYLSATGKGAGQEASAYNQVLAWKGAVFTRQKQAHIAVARPEFAPLCAELRAAASQLAMLSFVQPEPEQQPALQRQLADASQRKDRLEAELAQRSDVYRHATERASAAKLRSALPPDVALVDVFEYLKSLPATREKPDPEGVRSIVAFVVRADRQVARIELGPAGPIESAIDTWRRTCGSPGKGAEAGQQLRCLVWTPLEGLLESCTTVLISPDGQLGRFPWAALPGSKPGTYLIEERATAVVPVPRALTEGLPPAAGGNAATDVGSSPSLLLLGEIDYDAAATVAPRATGQAPGWTRSPGLKFTPLENSRSEILAIRDSFERAYPDTPPHVLRGDRATEAAFCQESPRHRWIHMATHGFFAPAPNPPSLQSAQAPHTRRSVPETAELHPGILSGLALAGANRSPQSGEDDGLLTAEEVGTLDLRRVELVGLSACETGLGTVAAGEGVLGLQRAFQVAGARTVVASLWKVSDQETRQLMERFYENLWQKKLGKLESLRRAQLAMIHDASRGMTLVSKDSDASPPPAALPYSWAAFVLSGDWR